MHNTHNEPLHGFIEIDGFKLKYQIEGKGIPALIIGSELYYSRVFSPQLRNELQLIFIDHRGFVKDAKMDISKLSIDTFIHDIEHIRKALKLDKFLIIGHSGHGYMALEYAKRFPQFITHVVLIAMGPDQSALSRRMSDEYFFDSVCPERKAIFEKDMAKLAKELELYPEKRFITLCLRLGARSWYDYNFDAAPLWENVNVNMPIMDYTWGIIFKDIDITKNLELLDKPILLILSKFDYLVTPFYAWNQIKEKFGNNLTIRLFEKSSHTPQFEEPELFDEELIRWISSRGI